MGNQGHFTFIIICFKISRMTFFFGTEGVGFLSIKEIEKSRERVTRHRLVSFLFPTRPAPVTRRRLRYRRLPREHHRRPCRSRCHLQSSPYPSPIPAAPCVALKRRRFLLAPAPQSPLDPTRRPRPKRLLAISICGLYRSVRC
jgi:hypothetical protein